MSFDELTNRSRGLERLRALSYESVYPPASRVRQNQAAAIVDVILSRQHFVDGSVRSYNAIRVMSTALPNLQQLSIYDLGYGHKYSDGEDPDEGWTTFTDNWTTHDIELIFNFRKLCSLNISRAPLNGRFPVLFNFNFPLLQKLTIKHCQFLMLDLEMLEGLPLLKELFVLVGENALITVIIRKKILTIGYSITIRFLRAQHRHNKSGNLRNLRVLKNSLEKAESCNCPYVEGNFMDFADFPRLKELNLTELNLFKTNNVTGEISGTSVDMISQLWSTSISQGASTMVECIISFSTFLTCLVSCKRSTSSCNVFQR